MVFCVSVSFGGEKRKKIKYKKNRKWEIILIMIMLWLIDLD